MGKEKIGRETMMVMSSMSLPGRQFKYLKYEGFEDSGSDCMMVPLLNPKLLDFKMTNVETKERIVSVVLPQASVYEGPQTSMVLPRFR
jgi:hypothetical protein